MVVVLFKQLLITLMRDQVIDHVGAVAAGVALPIHREVAESVLLPGGRCVEFVPKV